MLSTNLESAAVAMSTTSTAAFLGGGEQAMKSFDSKSSPGSMVKAGLKTIGMGLGYPKTRPLVLKFKPVQDELDRSKDAANKAENEQILAQGECELAATLCYEDVDAMQHDLEAVVGKDYRSPLYKAFFLNGLPAFKAQSPEALDKQLPLFIQTLKDSGAAKLTAHVPIFEAHARGLKKPLATAATAQAKSATAQLALGRATVSWLDGYASLEADFHSAFPRRKRFVASFFPVASNPGKKKPDPKIAELQKQNDDLQAQLTDFQKKNDALQAQLVGLQAAIDTLTKQVAQLQSQLPPAPPTTAAVASNP